MKRPDQNSDFGAGGFAQVQATQFGCLATRGHFYGQKSAKIIEKSLYSISGLVYYRPPIESNITNIIAEQRALFKMYV